MLEPLPITVVVPAYNAAPYLAAALESVRRQSAPAQEIIVVDDGSTDDTVAIARKFGTHVITGINRGVAHARNAGIRASGTPWIAFLDADDLWSTDRLERQWQARAAAPAALVVATDYRCLVDGRVVVDAVLPTMAPYRHLSRQTVAPNVTLVRGRDLSRAFVYFGNFVPPSTLLVDRRVFGEFDEYFAIRESLPDGGAEFDVAEDYEWYLRVLRHTDVLFVERPLLDYRKHATSLSANSARQKHGDVVLGELIEATPERYVPGTSEAFARARHLHLYEAGLRYLRAGDVVRARTMFVRASRAGHQRAPLFAAATSAFASASLGRRLFTTIFAIWRTHVRPLVRRSPRARA